VAWEDNERMAERSPRLSLARTGVSHRNVLQTLNQRRSLMSKEFEKLEALLCLSEPNEHEPQVDRGEAAKLAARWRWLLHRGCEQGVGLPQMRRPDRGALGTG
jgi:hypothetical protein